MVADNFLLYRIKTKDLQVYESSDNKKWKKSSKETQKLFGDALIVATLFQQHRNVGLITDEKEPRFLKGAWNRERAIGTRITVLPNGTELTKAYNLFAKHLRVHDEQSHYHWDVLLQNPSGSYTYIYTKEKEQKAKTKKFKGVQTFDKALPKLKRNLTKSITDDPIALPMIILLKTYMRIGSEVYYKKNKHKGLTTLQKRDVSIRGNEVTFTYIAKDGVPMKITEQFSEKVIQELKRVLKKKKRDEFIFSDTKGHPIRDTAFEQAFIRYCGTKFYPHIVRSHYATTKAKEFFKKNKKTTPEQIQKLYYKIAEKLGHKAYSKKTGEWKESYTVTLQYYVQKEIAEKIAKLVKN